MTDHRPELRPLTAFRFFAALAVFFRHIYPWFKDNPDMPWALRCFMSDGYCGVTFFFVLSGFILTYNYRSALVNLSPTSLRQFYVARFARIWPVQLLTFGLALIVLHQEIWAAPSRYIGPALANLTLTQSFFPDERIYFSFNSVSWSLSDEIFFYAIFPFALWGMHSTGCNRPCKASLLAIGLWSIALFCVLNGRSDSLGFWMWYVNPCFRVIDFIIGMALAQIFLALKQRSNFVPGSSWAQRLEVMSLAGIAAALLASPQVPYLLRRSVYYTPFFALTILVFAYQKGPISRVLSGRTFRLLGEASFSFYMFHYLLIRMIDRFPHATHLGNVDPQARSIIVFVVSLFTSIGCYCRFEVPARNRLRNWLTHSRRDHPNDTSLTSRKATNPDRSEVVSARVVARSTSLTVRGCGEVEPE